MKSHLLWSSLIVAVSLVSLRGAATSSQESGLSTESSISQRLTGAMRGFVEQGELAGAVTLVARDGRIIAFDAVGCGDLSTHRVLKKDDLFWVASMTKPITAAAVMMLIDEGRLTLDAPVETYLPEFKNQWVIAETSTDRQTLRRPARPVTIRDLLTHTGGLAEPPVPRAFTPLAQWVDEAARMPLLFEPGSQWRYGNAGMNTLGRVIEVVSGQPYEAFTQSRILTPLGMTDTTFFPNTAQLERLAKSYRKLPNGGALEESPITLLNGELSSTRRTVFPGGGLFSTATDMLRFYQLLLDEGMFEGRRLLSASAVAAMTHSQTGSFEAGFSPGTSWGLGLSIVSKPTGSMDMLPAGSFGHGGAYGTSVMVAPAQRLVMILMIQRSRLNPYRDGFKFTQAFHTAILGSDATQVNSPKK